MEANNQDIKSSPKTGTIGVNVDGFSADGKQSLADLLSSSMDSLVSKIKPISNDTGMKMPEINAEISKQKQTLSNALENKKDDSGENLSAHISDSLSSDVINEIKEINDKFGEFTESITNSSSTILDELVSMKGDVTAGFDNIEIKLDKYSMQYEQNLREEEKTLIEKEEKDTAVGDETPDDNKIVEQTMEEPISSDESLVDTLDLLNTSIGAIKESINNRDEYESNTDDKPSVQEIVDDMSQKVSETTYVNEIQNEPEKNDEPEITETKTNDDAYLDPSNNSQNDAYDSNDINQQSFESEHLMKNIVLSEEKNDEQLNDNTVADDENNDTLSKIEDLASNIENSVSGIFDVLHSDNINVDVNDVSTEENAPIVNDVNKNVSSTDVVPSDGLDNKENNDATPLDVEDMDNHYKIGAITSAVANEENLEPYNQIKENDEVSLGEDNNQPENDSVDIAQDERNTEEQVQTDIMDYERNVPNSIQETHVTDHVGLTEKEIADLAEAIGNSIAAKIGNNISVGEMVAVNDEYLRKMRDLITNGGA